MQRNEKEFFEKKKKSYKNLIFTFFNFLIFKKKLIKINIFNFLKNFLYNGIFVKKKIYKMKI